MRKKRWKERPNTAVIEHWLSRSPGGNVPLTVFRGNEQHPWEHHHCLSADIYWGWVSSVCVYRRLQVAEIHKQRTKDVIENKFPTLELGRILQNIFCKYVVWKFSTCGFAEVTWELWDPDHQSNQISSVPMLSILENCKSYEELIASGTTWPGRKLSCLVFDVQISPFLSVWCWVNSCWSSMSSVCSPGQCA